MKPVYNSKSVYTFNMVLPKVFMVCPCNGLGPLAVLVLEHPLHGKPFIW